MKGWVFDKIESVVVVNSRKPPSIEPHTPKPLPMEIHRKVRNMVKAKTGGHLRDIEVVQGPWYHLVEGAMPAWSLKGRLSWVETHFSVDVFFEYYGDVEDERFFKDPKMDLPNETLPEPTIESFGEKVENLQVLRPGDVYFLGEPKPLGMVHEWKPLSGEQDESSLPIQPDPKVQD